MYGVLREKAIWLKCRSRWCQSRWESFQPVYHPRIDAAARCDHANTLTSVLRSQTENARRPPCFPGTETQFVPPLRIARRGEVIFLGSRNNFPNPPFRSSVRESNLSMHARHRKFVTKVPRTCCMLKMRSRRSWHALECRWNFLILKRLSDTWYMIV